VAAGGTATGGTGSAGGASAGGSAVTAGAGGSSMAGAPAGGSSSGGGGPLVATKVFIAGDSTVSTYKDTASDKDQAGWGQMLPEFFGSLVTVDNRAVGGRTARRFIDEGYLDKIWSDIKKGDYLLVQFGTNDSNKSATYTLNGQTIPYYLDPATDFKTYLQKYIDGAASRGATLILVTPPPRNSAYCTGGNGTGAYAEAMRQLGTAKSIAVSDLNRKSVDYLKVICPSPTPEDFFLLKADGSVDGTHFQENGARHLARFVSEGLREAASRLAAYLK
jgi:lysophospholipase L1-like esterase